MVYLDLVKLVGQCRNSQVKVQGHEKNLHCTFLAENDGEKIEKPVPET